MNIIQSIYYLLITLLIITSCTEQPKNAQKNNTTTPKANTIIKKETSEKLAPQGPTQDTKETIEGMFVYMADANMFFPCDGSARLPIASSPVYLELEKNYLALVDGGTKIFVEVTGEIKASKSVEGNTTLSTLFISKINRISKDQKC